MSKVSDLSDEELDYQIKLWSDHISQREMADDFYFTIGSYKSDKEQLSALKKEKLYRGLNKS